MSEHPILFSSEMVRATLDGRKTQTRIVVKKPARLDGLMLDGEAPDWCPYGKVGDLLWVKETWWDLGYNENGKWQGRMKAHTIKPRYVATCPDPFAEGIGGVVKPKRIPWGKAFLFSSTWRKRSSIHMPKWAARIRLEITGIRVERVQQIDAVEAEAEGMRRPKRLCPDRHDEYILGRFIRLWDSINAKRGYGWDENPWVWVIEFKRHE